MTVAEMRTNYIHLQSPIQGLNHRTVFFWRDQKVTDKARSGGRQCPAYWPPYLRSITPNDELLILKRSK